MKVLILAGGLQSTLSDVSVGIPKPMARIGGRPILWHIMKSFSKQGFCEFIICGGYKVEMIKDYFRDFYIYESDITVDLAQNSITIHKKKTENWKVTVIDTGVDTAPGKRILQVRELIGDKSFIVVHGDCLSDIDVKELVEKHEQEGGVATLAVARPTGRNEVLCIEGDDLLMKEELATLPQNQAWVNACCKVFTEDIFRYLEKNGDLSNTLFGKLAEVRQITTYKHYGFWTPIETKRDYAAMENMWQEDKAPWKIWSD